LAPLFATVATSASPAATSTGVDPTSPGIAAGSSSQIRPSPFPKIFCGSIRNISRSPPNGLPPGGNVVVTWNPTAVLASIGGTFHATFTFERRVNSRCSEIFGGLPVTRR
jgi:hypothetical protein